MRGVGALHTAQVGCHLGLWRKHGGCTETKLNTVVLYILANFFYSWTRELILNNNNKLERINRWPFRPYSSPCTDYASVIRYETSSLKKHYSHQRRATANSAENKQCKGRKLEWLLFFPLFTSSRHCFSCTLMLSTASRASPRVRKSILKANAGKQNWLPQEPGSSPISFLPA